MRWAGAQFEGVLADFMRDELYVTLLLVGTEQQLFQEYQLNDL